MTVVDDARLSIRRRVPQLRLGALLALALAAGAAAWVVVSDGGSASPSAAAQPIPTPRLVSSHELENLGTTEGGPVYWVGARPNGAYELTQAPQGRTFVRYLDSPAQLGSPQPSFLAVATYAQPNAYAAILAASKRPGAVTIRPANGGLAVYDRARPTSIFLAYPGGNRQVEVYGPSPARIRQLVETGAVSAIPLPGVPRLVTPRELSIFAADREGKVFWAGRLTPRLIELTETSQGNVFVRYLAKASEVGSPVAAYVTIATYSRPNALASLKAASQRRGAVALRAPRGGLAVFDKAHPTSVYLAYPGGNRQIEVYHPDPRKARALVQSGAITAVP